MLFSLAEFILAYSTEWTSPICRKILECSARSDTIVWITYCRVIYISTNVANILFHNSLLVLLLLNDSDSDTGLASIVACLFIIISFTIAKIHIMQDSYKSTTLS